MHRLKKGLFLRCGSMNTSSIRRSVYLYVMYTSSRGKIKRSRSKSEFQMFSLISVRHVGVPRKDIKMASATGDN